MEVLSLKKWLTIGLTGMTKLNTWLAFLVSRACMTIIHTVYRNLCLQSPEDPSLLDFASDASKFIAAYATSPASTYTSHIYLSALPLSHPSNYVRSCYLPRFQGPLKVPGTLMNKLTQVSLTDWVTNDRFKLAALLPGSDLIALCSYSGRISVRNIYNGRHFVQPFETETTPVTYIGGSRNSTQVACGTVKKLAVWNMHDGSFIAGVSVPVGNHFTSFAISVDGTHIACGLFDGGIGTLNLQDPTFEFRSLKGHTRRVQSIDFSPNGTRFVSRSLDDTIRIWDVFTGDTLLVLNDTQGSKIVQFLPDGTHITTAPGSSRGSICVWDISNASYFEQHFHDKIVVSPLAVSPNAHETSIAIVLELPRHTAFEIRNAYTGISIAGPFKGHRPPINYIAFSDDVARVVSTAQGYSVKVWDAHGRTAQGSSEAPVTRRLNAELSLITSPDQKKAAAVFSSSVDIWDSRAMTPVASIPWAQPCARFYISSSP
jgi:WD40 repeat protein